MRILRGENRAEIMLSAKRILAVSPHPDDSELIAGGFLSYSKNNRKEIYILIVTDGSLGYRSEEIKDEIKNIRAKEQELSGKVFNAKEIIYINYKDTETPEPRILRSDILKYLAKIKPDLVVTVDPYLRYESHPDHINTGFAVLQAAYLSGVYKLSSVPYIALGATDLPNVYLELSEEEFRDKVTAISYFKSQFDDPEAIAYSFSYSPLFPDKLVEAFRVLLPRELHLAPYKD